MASENLRIAMVNLHSTETRLHNKFDPLIPNQRLQGQFKIGAIESELKTVINEKDEKQRFVRFYVETMMRYVKEPVSKEAQEDEELFSNQLASSIKAKFVAEYTIVNDMDIPEESLAEFGKYNVPHNIWPYWREYCQSTCSRMALPVIVIPLLQMPPDGFEKKPEN